MPATPPPTTSAALLTGSENSSSGSSLAGARHRHAHDVLGLLGGLLLLLGVDPGAVLADVRHVEEVLVDARFAQRVAEQRLVRPRRAGGDHHAVQALVADGVGDRLGGVGGAGEQALLDVNHVAPGSWRTRRRRARRPRGRCWRRSGRRRRRPSASSSRRVLLLRVDPLLGQLAAPRLQQLRRTGRRRRWRSPPTRECPSAPGRRR